MNTDIINELKENGFETVTNKSDIEKLGIEMLKNDNELFVNMVNEVDSYNGIADGYRCYDMGEIDEMYYGIKLSEFLSYITKDFNFNDEYFYHSIYGIESLESFNDVVTHYRDNIYESDLWYYITEYSNHLYFDNDEFKLLVDSYNDFDEEE